MIRQAFCYKLCYQREVFIKCKCYDSTTPKLNSSIHFCQTGAEFSCLGKFYNTFYNSDVRKFCNADCPLECESMVYRTAISTASYPPLASASHFLANEKLVNKFHSTNVTMEQLRESILMLFVYFDEISYYRIEEKPSFTLNDLLANLGGQLGLFIGKIEEFD